MDFFSPSLAGLFFIMGSATGLTVITVEVTMTDNELERKRSEYRYKMTAEGYGWVDGKYIQPPASYKLELEELSCIDMINSILAYGGFGMTAEEIMQHQEKSCYNYLAKYVNLLGRGRVVELIQGQIDSIDTIRLSTFTDDDGIHYNSIVWKQMTK